MGSSARSREAPQLASFPSPAVAESWNHTSPSLYTSESRPVWPVLEFFSGTSAARSSSRSLSWPVFPVLQAQSPGIILVRPSTRAKVGQFGQFPSFPVASRPLEVPQLASFSSLAVAGSACSMALLSSQAKCSPVGQFRSFPVGLPLLPSSQLSSFPVFQSELGRSYRRHIRE